MACEKSFILSILFILSKCLFLVAAGRGALLAPAHGKSNVR
jgi:hypothetical protein